MWKLGDAQDEAGLDIALPLEEGAGHRRNPWLLTALDVNALNFCGFAMCVEQGNVKVKEENDETLLIAVPSALNSDSVILFFLLLFKTSKDQFKAEQGYGDRLIL